MLALLLTLGLAQAGDGQSGWYLPGALPMEKSSGSAGVFTGLLLAGYGRQTATAGFEASWAFADRMSLFAFVLSDAQQATGLGPSGHVSVRWMAVEQDEVRIAPYVMAAGVFGFEAASGGLGVAVDAGWDFLRFDVSSPLVMVEALHDVGWEVGPRFTPRTLEAGVTLVMDLGHRLRIGYPVVSYHLVRERFHMDFGAALVNASVSTESRTNTAGLWLKLGFRF